LSERATSRPTTTAFGAIEVKVAGAGGALAYVNLSLAPVAEIP
jgi:hypothetical protein